MSDAFNSIHSTLNNLVSIKSEGEYAIKFRAVFLRLCFNVLVANVNVSRLKLDIL